MRPVILAGAFAALLAAGCGSSQPATTAQSQAASRPAPTASHTLAPRSLADAPFKVKVVRCGWLTHPQYLENDRDSHYGMVVVLTNRGQRTLEANLDVEFLKGRHLVDGDNITAPWHALQPGESEREIASIKASSGAGHRGDSCQVEDLNVYVPGSSATLGTYYPATRMVTRYHHRPRSSPPPAPSAPAVSLGCKVLQTGSGGEEFNVTTVGGGSYSGAINVSFYGPAGSGEVFPGTSVQGATPVGHWYPVPAADIGASAEPVGCVASALRM